MVQRIGSLDIYEAAYRRQFFSAADLAGKMTMISRRGGRIAYVNFYFRDSAPPTFPPDIAERGPLLAELVHKHDTLTGGHFGARTAKARAEAYLRSALRICRCGRSPAASR